MGRPGRPKKDPAKRKDTNILIRVTKTRKQWIKNCAKGKGVSMTRYIEMLINDRCETYDRVEFVTFLYEMKDSLERIRRAVENGSSPGVVNGFVNAAIQRVNRKGRDLYRAKNEPAAAGEDE